MKYWGEYKNRLANTILGQQKSGDTLSYYRNQLFFHIILYALIFSPIAIVPGIIASYKTGYLDLLILNNSTFLVLLILAFVKPIKIETRKLILLVTLFIISWSLLFRLDLEGPGMIYLFAVTIVSCLIHSVKFAYLTIILNSVTLGLIGLNIELQVIPLSLSTDQSITVWFGIVVNLIFLSLIIVGCFGVILKKLEKIIINQRILNKKVNLDNQNMMDAQKVLKVKNEELNQFAHIIAHDLKEPLRSMQAFAHLVITKYKGTLPEKGQEYLTYIKTASERMALLLNSLLDYSQIGKGKKKSSFSVNELVKELEQDLSQLIKENNARLEYEDLPVITAFEFEFKQLLQNLIANAIKFKKDDEEIQVRIKVYETPKYWKFLITDNGIGIDPQHQEKIFKMFHRLHTKKFPGTGLGLANCKKIVEMHDGEIGVDSKPGKGSTFYFTTSKHLDAQVRNV